MSVVQDNQSDGDYQLMLSSQHSNVPPEESYEARNNHSKCSDEMHSNAGFSINTSSNLLQRSRSNEQYESEKTAIYRHTLSVRKASLGTSFPGAHKIGLCWKLSNPTPATLFKSYLQRMDILSFKEGRCFLWHALFPLLALLFERCEQATRSPDSVSVAGLKADIQLFVQHQQQLHESKSSVYDNPEVDSLMLRAIQTLRIHLLELEKVNELCRDFCTRYISCLRSKMQNEQLLHLDSFDGESIGGPLSGNKSLADGVDVDGIDHGLSNYQDAASRYQLSSQLPSLDVGRLSATGQFYQEQRRHSPEQRKSVLGENNESNSIHSGILESLACLDDVKLEDSHSSSTHPASGLTKHAKHLLKSWFIDHLEHPYPTESDIQLISVQTNLSLSQIDSWFVSARFRISQQSEINPEWKIRRRLSDKNSVETVYDDAIENSRSIHSTPLAVFGCDYEPVEDGNSTDKSHLEPKSIFKGEETGLDAENIHRSMYSSIESVDSVLESNQHVSAS